MIDRGRLKPGPFKLKKYKDEWGNVRYARLTPRWKVIIFYKGKRIIKYCWKPQAGQTLVDKLSRKGIRAHVVCRRYPKFKARGVPDDPIQRWCPYCRRWRYFSVPKNPRIYFNNGTACCQWCLIPESDPEVALYNQVHI